MKIPELRRLLKSGLTADEPRIRAHIDGVTASGRTTNIEGIFANSLHRQFTLAGHDFEEEVALSKLGLKNYYRDRSGGRLDAYFGTSLGAFEHKAVRLPRLKPKFFDVGQLLPDYERLSSGSALQWGYIVVFCYGPLVLDARSDMALYRSFHNQMFVDCQVAAQERAYFSGQLVRELEWDHAWEGRPPAWATAVKVGTVGAVAISVF